MGRLCARWDALWTLLARLPRPSTASAMWSHGRAASDPSCIARNCLWPLAWLTSPVRCQLPGAPATGCDGWLAHRPLRPLPPGAPAVPQEQASWRARSCGCAGRAHPRPLLAAPQAAWLTSSDSQHAGRRKIPLSAAPTVKFPELQFLLLWSGPDLVSITVNLCYNCTVPRSMQRQDASAVTARAVVAALNPRIDRDKKRLC
jgi:hypothetical protein